MWRYCVNVPNVLAWISGLFVGVLATFYFLDRGDNFDLLKKLNELENDKVRLEEQLKALKKDESSIVERVRNREKSKQITEILIYWRSAKHHTPGPYSEL